MAVIYGDDGRQLAVATVRPADDLRIYGISRVASGKGRLLQYYFGQGRRAVDLQVGDFRLKGVLRTEWLGHERLWLVALREPALAGSLEARREPVPV
jgi:hypothetical protein